MKKLIILVLCLCSMLGNFSALAAESLDVDSDTSNIIIRGAATQTEQNRGAVTISIWDKDDNLVYMNEARIVSGKYFSKFKFNDFTDCKVKVYDGEDITDYAIVEKNHGDCITSNVSVVNDGTNTWFDTDDVINLKAEIVNLYMDDTDLTVYLAGFDNQNRMIDLKKCEKYVDFGCDGQSVDFLIEGFSSIDNLSYVKSFIWESENQSPTSKAYKRETMESTFQDGDVVALVGDSITEVSIYVMLLEHFYQTRYPERNIAFYNKGCSGHAAYNMNDRFEWDVMAEHPNKITIMDGFNEFSWNEYDYSSPDLESIVDKRAYADLEHFQKICDKAKAAGAELTVCTPSMYEELDPTRVWENRNSILTRFSDLLKQFASSNNINCYDTNAVSNEWAANGADKNLQPPYITSSDGVHPYAFGSTAGAYALMYGILKDQKASDTVASAYIDSANVGMSKFDNCSVTNIAVTDTGVSYIYLPYSIPIAFTPTYANVQKLFDLTSAINREIIKISGLSDGNYALTMNGDVIGTYSASELSEGINIAVNENNPNQKQAKIAYEYMMAKSGFFSKTDENGNEILAERQLRALKTTEGWALSAKLNPMDLDSMRNYFKSENEYQAYLDKRSKEGLYKENMAKYAALAKNASKANEVNVSVQKVD